MSSHIYYESENCKRAGQTLKKLRPGDVLLCKSRTQPPTYEDDKIQHLIHKASGSLYFHAGIFIGDDRVLEMGHKDGAEITELKDFLFNCHFCFVSRNEMFWVNGAVDKLDDYADEVVNESVEYDLMLAYRMLKNSGAKLPWKVKLPILSLVPIIWLQHKVRPKKRMICSELVAHSFHNAGLFSEDAAKLFNTDIMPHELVVDMAYGLPLGYISDVPSFKPDTEDELYHLMY